MTTHVFVVDPVEEARVQMAEALGPDEPWVAHDSLPQVAQSIDRGALPAIVLVGPGVVHDDAIMLAESIQDEQLAVRIIQFTKVLDPDRLRDAMRAGVADVVEVGADPEEVGDAVVRAERDLAARIEAVAAASPVDAQQPTPVIAVTAGKGGVGTSLVTTNLVTAIARLGGTVGLVDLDVSSGDLAIMFQRRPSLTVLDAVDRVDHLDADAMSGYLTEVAKGVHLLAAPLAGGEIHVPTGPFMRLLGMVADTVDVVVVDLGQTHDSTARAVLAEARRVVVVTTREVTGVRGTRRVLSEMGAIGVPADGTRLVVNRADESTGLSVPDIEKALNRGVDVAVPSDKSAARSINQGDPLVNRRRSKAGQALEALARDLMSSLGLLDDDA